MADNYLERKFEEMEKRKKSIFKSRYGRMRASSLHTFKPLQTKEKTKDDETK